MSLTDVVVASAVTGDGSRTVERDPNRRGEWSCLSPLTSGRSALLARNTPRSAPSKRVDGIALEVKTLGVRIVLNWAHEEHLAEPEVDDMNSLLIPPLFPRPPHLPSLRASNVCLTLSAKVPVRSLVHTLPLGDLDTVPLLTHPAALLAGIAVSRDREVRDALEGELDVGLSIAGHVVGVAGFHCEETGKGRGEG